MPPMTVFAVILNSPNPDDVGTPQVNEANRRSTLPVMRDTALS